MVNTSQRGGVRNGLLGVLAGSVGFFSGCASDVDWQAYSSGRMSKAEYDQREAERNEKMGDLLLGATRGRAVQQGNAGAAAATDTLGRIRSREAGRSNVEQNVFAPSNRGFSGAQNATPLEKQMVIPGSFMVGYKFAGDKDGDGADMGDFLPTGVRSTSEIGYFYAFREVMPLGTKLSLMVEDVTNPDNPLGIRNYETTVSSREKVLINNLFVPEEKVVIYNREQLERGNSIDIGGETYENLQGVRKEGPDSYTIVFERRAYPINAAQFREFSNIFESIGFPLREEVVSLPKGNYKLTALVNDQEVDSTTFAVRE